MKLFNHLIKTIDKLDEDTKAGFLLAFMAGFIGVSLYITFNHPDWWNVLLPLMVAGMILFIVLFCVIDFVVKFIKAWKETK